MASKAPPSFLPEQRKILRKEFSDFFTEMLRVEPKWPEISDQEFIDALADSLLDKGQRSGKGVALMQTLVYELQERVNTTLKG